MVNVFTGEVTPRKEYAFRLLFEIILNDVVEFHSDREQYLCSNGPKINYSGERDLPGLSIQPHGLLSETHVQFYPADLLEWEGEKALFGINDSDLPFDVFAAAFFLSTRYEEYLPGKRDRHQRFMARNSLAVQNHFIEKPLINIWAFKLADLLEQQAPGYRFQRPVFRYIPTFDIDNAWAFKNKGFVRISGSLFRDLAAGRWKLFRKRLSVVFRFDKDPYDNYDFLLESLKKSQLEPIFFFLLQNKGKHDRSLPHHNSSYRRLILRLAKQGKVGMHPSYNSNKNPRLIKKEKDRLENIIGRKVKRSRQHYLKLTMPKTYRRLIQQGIEKDYTMGYASRPGFRASICTPYPFFDLLDNQITSLKIYPFQVMDVTLLNYRNLRALDAIAKIRTLLKQTAEVGGTFISLWHNESLSDEGHWAGWRTVYTEMIQMAVELRNGQNHPTHP
ncbi:MAG TPA: polysaccharide deacetylase family protein [Prolixibacteraceae bacterium]|nr:polysaccharide deacetylase family protein [Prolixibacteraceae bacterium]